MARPSIPTRLVTQATQALVAGIEIYNKPAFCYRESAFAILAVNAWELLLKAKAIAISGNQLTTIYVYERRRTRNGAIGSKKYVKRNRCGNPMTISLLDALSFVASHNPHDVPDEIKLNLKALIEIRDNSIHYLNMNPALSQQVLEIGAATVYNYVILAQKWFSVDLSPYKLHLLPLGFIAPPPITRAAVLSGDEKKLLLYLSRLTQHNTQTKQPNTGFYAALEVQLKLARSAGAGASAVQSVRVGPNAPGSIAVHLTETDIRHQWPWDYRELTNRLRKRYSDFIENERYHSIRKPLISRPYATTRYLNPSTPGKGINKTLYSSAIIAEFDKYYTIK